MGFCPYISFDQPGEANSRSQLLHDNKGTRNIISGYHALQLAERRMIKPHMRRHPGWWSPKRCPCSPWGMGWGGIIGSNCHQSLNLSHQMRWFDVISGYFGAVLHFQAAALPNKKAVSMERLKAWAIRGIYWLICWPQCSIGFGNLFHTCDRQCRVLTFKTWSIAFYCNSVQYSMEFCTCIYVYIYMCVRVCARFSLFAGSIFKFTSRGC